GVRWPYAAARGRRRTRPGGTGEPARGRPPGPRSGPSGAPGGSGAAAPTGGGGERPTIVPVRKAVARVPPGPRAATTAHRSPAPQPARSRPASEDPLTEVPEHLLQRSRERRAALGLGGGDAGDAAPAASAAATPATSAAGGAASAAPAVRAPVPVAPGAPPPAPFTPPYVRAAERG